MDEVQLSKRLNKVVSYVEKGSSVADIGSDHAYLPVYLVRNNIAVKAVAGEVNKGPLLSAQNQIDKCGLGKQIKAKLGYGLAVLEEEDVDTITIAGMGGPLITQILEEGKERLTPIKRLILQPNIAAEKIRRFLLIHQWELKAESILEEDGHIYEVLMAEKGDPLAQYGENLEKELWLGPLLLQEKSSVFLKKWQQELLELKRIQKQLEGASETEELLMKKSEINKKISWLEEELC